MNECMYEQHNNTPCEHHLLPSLPCVRLKSNGRGEGRAVVHFCHFKKVDKYHAPHTLILSLCHSLVCLSHSLIYTHSSRCYPTSRTPRSSLLFLALSFVLSPPHHPHHPPSTIHHPPPTTHHLPPTSHCTNGSAAIIVANKLSKHG